MTALSYTINGPPVPKDRARKGKGGHWYTPQRTRSYELLARGMATLGRALWATKSRKRWPDDNRYAVTVRVFFGDLRRKDGDNVFKSIADAANGVLWADDSQIVKHTVEVHLDREKPRVEVEVKALCPADCEQCEYHAGKPKRRKSA